MKSQLPLEKLYDYVDVVYSLFVREELDKHCSAFPYFLTEILLNDQMADRQAYIVDSTYARLRHRYKPILYEKISKTLNKSKHKIAAVSATADCGLTIKERIASTMRAVRGENNSLVSVYTVSMLAMLSRNLTWHHTTFVTIPFAIIVSIVIYISVQNNAFRQLPNLDLKTIAGFLGNVLHLLSVGMIISEVVVNLKFSQLLYLMQLLWLNVIMVDRESQKKSQVIDSSTPTPNIISLLKTNIYTNMDRILLLTTFTFPSDVVAVAGTLYFLLYQIVTGGNSGLRSTLSYILQQIQDQHTLFVIGMSVLIHLERYVIELKATFPYIILLLVCIYFGVNLVFPKTSPHGIIYDILDTTAYSHCNLNRNHLVSRWFSYLRFSKAILLLITGFVVICIPLVLYCDAKDGFLLLNFTMFAYCIIGSLSLEIRKHIALKMETT